MTNLYEETLDAFEEKLQKLFSAYKALEEQNNRLQEELERKTRELMRSHKALLDLQDNYDHLRMARYLSLSPEERKISKQYMDKLVREIDKCLSLLNE